ncbi:MAG: 16S rRNA (cytosine(1402)-N(4))-methyltransferase RsmH [Armatimonadetes bacterium]|nr:16S rRNA (cytosine(1402)-N(4))-methyltransferase RsmH [Armatimonadota bacterium]
MVVHVPVMLQEVLEGLRLQPGTVVVDGTIGLAGHSQEILKSITPGGKLVGIDRDEGMLDLARERLGSREDVETRLFHSDFRSVRKCLLEAGEAGANAILLDLGLNAAQIDDPERGISFRTDGPLDMRIDRSQGETAAQILNTISVGDLERVLMDYGDERWARRIAQVLVDRRKDKRLATTDDLVDCVLAAIPAAKRDYRIHPATRTFQAVRIFVNGELDGLQEAIAECAKCLMPAGRMVVLSYHSGEDRAVKRAFRALSQENGFDLPAKKPATPSEAERQSNPKSRSAKLRLIERVPRKENDNERCTMDHR